MRTEKDFIGIIEIPDEALYGIHSVRAKANFPDVTPFHVEWYKAVGLVKKACYHTADEYGRAIAGKFGDSANSEVPGHLAMPDPVVLTHLIHAASDVAEGDYYDSFIVPAVSGGAGTSINMNVNEIIANVALVRMGEKPGTYMIIDPIEQANIFQSTNDVIPTSLRVAAMFLLQDLEKAINELRFVVEQKEVSHQDDLRIGYTQMQEAVPTSFGKLFSTYSDALSRDWWRVSKCFERIKVVNLGGSAIGTGLAVPRFFIMEAVTHLQQLTGLPVTRSENLSDATSNLDPFVEVHAILKAHAVNLEKMVSDLRLLASDLALIEMPSDGLRSSSLPDRQGGAIRHPALSIPRVQVGSSIMPGKVNPVIPEFVISATHKIYANDQLISALAAQGCLELNAYLPVIGHALLESLKLLIACDSTLKKNLFEGLTVNSGGTLDRLLKSPAVTTVLLPYVGYHKASELALHMRSTGKDIFQANLDLGILEDASMKTLMKPENLLKLGYSLSEIIKRPH